MSSWVEIDAAQLTANYEAVRSAAQPQGQQPIAVLAVVKANGYGHGAEQCAVVLAQAGAPWLGVTNAAEGARVRSALLRAGFECSMPGLLVMCCLLESEAATMVRERLTPVVWEPNHLAWLAAAVQAEEAAWAAQNPLSNAAGRFHCTVHIEIDTGMTRQGCAPGEDLAELLRLLARTPELRLGGVMTHLASAEIVGSPQTAAQHAAFEAAIGQIAAGPVQPQWVHVGNSSFIDAAETEPANAPSGAAWLAAQAARLGARPMTRAGLALYGYCLPLEGAPPEAAHLRPAVQPVMRWSTRVANLRDVEPGALIGYDGTFVARRPMKLALLPVGYADGLRRGLSSPAPSGSSEGGWVMVRGQRAPIVGRVSMNLTTVDVTGLQAEVGDEVLLLGPGISAEDHARLADVSVYEVICGVRGTMPANGRPTALVPTRTGPHVIK